MRIRRAVPADIAEIARVWRAGWLDGHVGNVPDEVVAARDEAHFLRVSTEQVDTTLLAVDDDGQLLGVVLVDGEELLQLAVASEARGRGVGQALVTAAEELIALEHDLAELGVAPGNTTARRLYERCGWTDRGEVTMPARPDEPGGLPVPVVLRHYVKQLR
jgi:ribosomal protein S18 acetylase RimI-like enzyme